VENNMDVSEPLPPVAASVAPKRPNRFLGIWGAVLLLVMVVAAQISCGIIIGIIHFVLSGRTKPSESQMAGSIAVMNTISIAVVIWFGLWWSKLPWRILLPLTRFHPLLLAPLLAAACGLCILASDAENLTRFLGLEPALLREAVGQLTQGGWWSMIVLVVVAPLTEEPLVRGVMLTGLLRRYSVARAVLYSAVLFAIMHLNPVQFAAALAIGLFLGWLYTRTRSLWPGIVMHAIYNAHVFLIPTIRDGLDIHIRGFTGSALPGIVEFQPAWFDALGLGLLALGVWGVLRLTPPVATGDGAEADAGVVQAIILDGPPIGCTGSDGSGSSVPH
jgi:membrane protease YdiL (CAAX protease family)